MESTINYKEIETLSLEYSKLCNNTINSEKYIAFSLTHHSTAIEGSTLTESQVVNLLEFGKTASTKPYEHHLMVSDFYKAFHFMEYHGVNSTGITIDFIKELGGLVVKSTGGFVNTALGSFDVSKGDFRLCSVRAGNRYFPDCKKVPKLVDDFIKETNVDLKKAKTFRQKMELAFRVHYAFVNIHPFGDGNGRTSRLLMNFVQKKFNLPYSFVFKEDKKKYIDSLENSIKFESLQPFYNFMFAQHLKMIKKELKSMR